MAYMDQFYQWRPEPGDLVKPKGGSTYGIFIGLRTFKGSGDKGNPYTCAEVMWHDRNAPNGDRISTIQTDLLEVINEDR